MKILKSLSCLSLIWGLLVFMTGCPQTAVKTEPLGMVYYTYFDTVSYIYNYAGGSQEEFDRICEQTAKILEEYHNLFDIYYEHSGVVNLCTINLNAGGEPLKVDQKLIDFLLYAKELYVLTGGEMNVMMGAVLRPWHDCRSAASDDPANATTPSPEVLEEASKHTSIDLLEIDEANLTVRISDPAASIDVGALGKGYATEKAAEYLQQQGASSYVLNIGGNIRIVGTKPDGSGWGTGIKNPASPDQYAYKITISNTSCVTSGDYERFFTVDGVKYHHVIDPDTLYPAAYFPSVSIFAKDSGLADALSTALFCMSYEDGLKLIESIGGIDVIWVDKEFNVRMTDGIESAD